MSIGRFGIICLGLIIGASELAAQPNAERSNSALDTLRAGVWMERGGLDSFVPPSGKAVEPVAAEAPVAEPRLIAVAWDMPQLTPPTLTPPTLIPGGGSGTPNRAPEVIEVKPIESVRAIAAVPKISGACEDLRKKASKLRNAAWLCDRDIANGHPFCNVEVNFDIPAIPRSLSAQQARDYAGQFESVVDRGNARGCADFGGPNYNPAEDASRIRADAHYRSLCSGGDHYACNARQIEELCFDTSPMNSCVRDCLVTRDDLCLAGSNSELSKCRIYSHFQCYYSCGKPSPNIPEGFCFYQLPGWSSFK